MMCQCRFTNSKKCTSMVGAVDSEGGYACLGQRVFGKSLCFLFNFIVKLKLLQIKSSKKRGG